MKVSLNWAQHYSNVDLKKINTKTLIEKIGAQLGEIESIETWGPRYEGIVVARVVSCQAHPNADKLHVCLIDDGKVTKGAKRDTNGLIQVVCGAPNVKADMIVAWLPPGVTVPATIGKDPLMLEAREIRGVVSNGMLGSASELGLSDDHAGLLEITSDDIDKSLLKPGTPFAKVYELDDTIIDIENKMFTHRPDCFGILGVARELAGITGHAFESPKWYIGDKTTGEHADDKRLLKVVNEIPELVPRFMVQIVEDVEVHASPVWLQSYLTRVGIRPINNIVDITNYMMHLTAQPMHAYDYDKVKQLSGATPTLVVRKAKKGDKLRILNGKTIQVEAPTIMIATDKVPVGVGGVMGGADTEVDENTKNIILEAATFDMYAIRRTSMKYGLFTDAVTRFNKGQSVYQNDRVMSQAIGEIIHQAGGRSARSIYDVKAKLPAIQPVRITSQFINERLGLTLTPAHITKLLENVEFKVMKAGSKRLAIMPPFWRTDIAIPEDIVEEVGRLYGYDHLPLQLPKRDLTPAKPDLLLELKSAIRNLLSRAGANELLTYSFVHGDLLDKVGQDRTLAYELSNALSPELQYFRLSLTPSLLEKTHPNIKAGYGSFALFEIGKSHNKKRLQDDGLPQELEKLSLIYSTRDASGLAGAPYYQAKKYLEILLNSLGIEVRYEPLKSGDDCQTDKPYELKRSAAVMNVATGKRLGIVGEFKASVRRSLKLPAATAGFELSTLKLLESAAPANYQPLPRYPKVEQDICLKVAAELPFNELDGLVHEVLDEHTNNAKVSVAPLDIYQREDDTAHKQVTFRVSIASHERTLTDKEVSKVLDMVTEVAAQKLSAERI